MRRGVATFFVSYPSIKTFKKYYDITETVYRRGARRWKKFYHVNGHRFQAKRLNRRVQCFFCNDYIWGLGRQGYRCADCRLCVHKKCHRAVRQPCGDVSFVYFATKMEIIN